MRYELKEGVINDAKYVICTQSQPAHNGLRILELLSTLGNAKHVLRNVRLFVQRLKLRCAGSIICCYYLALLPSMNAHPVAQLVSLYQRIRKE